MNTILNEKQLEIAKEWIIEFSACIAELERDKDNLELFVYELFYNSFNSMIADLQKQIEVYQNFTID